jgi:hypothetical protein
MVESINYAGKSYPIRIGYIALKSFEDEAGINLSEMGESLKYHEIILWHALVAGHRRVKEELTLTREDVPWILDESFAAYQRIFMDSMVQLAEEVSAPGAKKK